MGGLSLSNHADCVWGCDRVDMIIVHHVHKKSFDFVLETVMHQAAPLYSVPWACTAPAEASLAWCTCCVGLTLEYIHYMVLLRYNGLGGMCVYLSMLY